jgi:hypothetical protein
MALDVTDRMIYEASEVPMRARGGAPLRPRWLDVLRPKQQQNVKIAANAAEAAAKRATEEEVERQRQAAEKERRELLWYGVEDAHICLQLRAKDLEDKDWDIDRNLPAPDVRHEWIDLSEKGKVVGGASTAWIGIIPLVLALST